ncbi:two component transcriptional regulator, LuxR family [Paenibacillus sp. 1_12]|uniref:response regulator transcription factor n=1 Tax=Paenibacillus sp. 1_12 TaxID=1566278 RepID=UPI0008E2F30C|nr:response regulator transcription factor [Paenibacillus sp. 1_12]SFL87416.1 two component transcriptional regulator, LuxR family [Paenibacillus sp. 1_12]
MLKRVLIVDDHPVMAKATQMILEQIENIQVIGIAASGKSCLEMTLLHKPDMIMLDYNLPDQFGSSVAKQIKDISPNTHIVIFTGIDVSDLYNQLIELGVSGIISKESSERVIQNMIRCIMDGYTMIPLSLYRGMRLMNNLPAQEALLTKDEIQIMTLVVRGSTQEQVANEIFVSKRSVDNYLKKIYAKLGVKSRVQAIEKFIQSSYYTDSDKSG